MAMVVGTNGNNTLNGTADFDIIIGRAGNDQLSGLGEQDILSGGLGNDRVDGGAGKDVAIYSNVVIEGTTHIGATAGVTVNLNLAGAQNTGGAGIDTLVSIEDLVGTNFADTLTGNAVGNQLWGLGGNDRLNGGAGDDDLVGGLGNDRLDGGTGIDTAAYRDIEIGTGPGATAGVMVNLNLQGIAQNTGGAGSDILVSIENLSGTNFNDTLIGNASDNDLSGQNGNDTLNGGGGSDELVGGLGNDRLDGGTGGDVMFGGAGNDTYIVDNGNDVAFEISATQDGVDLVQAAVSYTMHSGIDYLSLTGSSAINGTGNALNNQITGNSANNVLSGLNGNDTLAGGAGTDTLNGDEGTDVLIGGLGADTLNGGSGNDTFDYNAVSDSPAGAGRDVIQDFRGVFTFEGDRIDLRDIDANSLAAGNQTFSYIGFDAFTAAGQLRYSSITGIVQGNTDADSAPEFEIQLIGGPVLTVNNIVSDILL